MTYDRQILNILMEAGDGGVSVQVLVRHVYNMNSTLFSSPDIGDVHRYVRQYLQRNSKSERALVESTGRRGYYRLNTKNNADARQLMLEFSEEKTKTEVAEPADTDLSLNLFD